MFSKKQIVEAKCKQCGNGFEKKTYNQKFCSNSCRNDFFNEIKAKAMEFYRKSEPK
jgi:endogenous inhibitor of DNA gyrase (YacG/DUF329 family)